MLTARLGFAGKPLFFGELGQDDAALEWLDRLDGHQNLR